MKNKLWLAAAVLIGSAVVVIGSAFATPTDEDTQAGAVDASTDNPSTVVVRFNPDEAAQELARIEREQHVTASPAEVAAVSDGTLTDSEYRSAVQAEMDCITAAFDRGAVAVSELIRDGGNYTFSVAVDYESDPGLFPTEESKAAYSDQVSTGTDRCAAEHSTLVKLLVGDRRDPPTAD